MAIYHLSVKNISREGGRSIVTAAAYRAGEILTNEIEERLSDFAGRRDVVANEILLPDGAPAWMRNRTQLWNAVEAIEKRKDARLAKELEFAIPRELPQEAWLPLVRQMGAAYTAQGFVVDFAIHEDGSGNNPHAHMLLTTRVVTQAGFGLKIRSADGRQFVTEARSVWERVANTALKNAGVDLAIDQRSYSKRGLKRAPGLHRGPDPMERRLRRQRQMERDIMRPEMADVDLPVPDPDGNPIHPRELESAERQMLDAVQREEAPDLRSLDSDLQAAQAAVEQQASHEMTDDEAAAYRLAPPDLLDWLQQLPDSTADLEVLERWENHMDWLGDNAQIMHQEKDEGPSPEQKR